MTPAGFVMHAPVSPGQQAAAWVVAVAVALALKVGLAWRFGPRRRHLRATRRNGVMLARPVPTGYHRRW